MPDPISPQPHLVELARTQSFAQLAHQQLIAPARLPGLAAVSGAQLATAPTVIYDLNGQPLFHDYALQNGASVVGTVRCSANRQLGAPVFSIAHAAPGWNAASALRMATESLHASDPSATVASSQLVCYAYPKIGIKLEFKSATGADVKTQIFDASSGKPVGNSSDAGNQFTAYSLLGSLPATEIALRVTRFTTAEQQLEVVQSGKPVSPIFTGTRQGSVKLSPFCQNSPPGLTHYAQILDYFCVDASAQMLLEHYGYNYTQNQIAAAMGTTAAQGGTSGSGLTNGFTSLTSNTLALSFDGGASRAQQFLDAVAEIDANRPLFTQVPHHYRVCMGYFENTLETIFSTLGFDQSIYIYDPWPWNPDQCQPGAPYWESWASSPVMWFGIVHHRS